MVSFQTKNPNLVGPWMGKCWYILGPFGIFYRYLGYFMITWYILCSFGTFFWVWYHVPRKIWQPCCARRKS
jgi:hypothetical protein